MYECNLDLVSASLSDDKDEDLSKCLSPSCLNEYDLQVNGEITSTEKKRFWVFLILMILATPGIIYAMANLSKDSECNLSSDSVLELNDNSSSGVECSYRALLANIGLLVVFLSQ